MQPVNVFLHICRNHPYSQAISKVVPAHKIHSSNTVRKTSFKRLGLQAAAHSAPAHKSKSQREGLSRQPSPSTGQWTVKRLGEISIQWLPRSYGCLPHSRLLKATIHACKDPHRLSNETPKEDKSSSKRTSTRRSRTIITMPPSILAPNRRLPQRKRRVYEFNNETATNA